MPMQSSEQAISHSHPPSPTEPGLYSERGAGDTTVFTIIGRHGRPIFHAAMDNAEIDGGPPPEIQALYDRCVGRYLLRLL